jgi:hypothetical protein
LVNIIMEVEELEMQIHVELLDMLSLLLLVNVTSFHSVSSVQLVMSMDTDRSIVLNVRR